MTFLFSGKPSPEDLLDKGKTIREQHLPNQNGGLPINTIMVPPTPLSEYIDYVENLRELDQLQLEEDERKEAKDRLFYKRRNYEAEVSVYRAVERLGEKQAVVLHSLEYTKGDYDMFSDKKIESGRIHSKSMIIKDKKGKNKNDLEGENDILFIGKDYFVIIEVKANPYDVDSGRIQALRTKNLIEGIFNKMKEDSDGIQESEKPRIIKCVAIPLCVKEPIDAGDEEHVTGKEGQKVIRILNNGKNKYIRKVGILDNAIQNEVINLNDDQKHKCFLINEEDLQNEAAEYICKTDLKDDTSFRRWWERNVKKTLDDRPPSSEVLELYKKCQDVLIGLWGEKKKRSASLRSNVLDIDKKLRTGHITFKFVPKKGNPNVVEAPSAINKYLEIEYLTKKQDEVFKKITERNVQYLWIHGPAGSGKTVLLAGSVMEFAIEKKILVMTNDSKSSSVYETAFDKAGLKFVSSKCERVEILENKNKCAITIVENRIETYEHLRGCKTLLKHIAEKFDLVVIDCNRNEDSHTDGIRNIASELESKYKNVKLAIKKADSATCADRVVKFHHLEKILVYRSTKPGNSPISSLYETACKEAYIKYRILNKYDKKEILRSREENTVTIVEDVSITHYDDLRYTFATEIAQNFDLIVLDDCNGGKSANVNIACISYFFESMKSFCGRTRCLIATDIAQRSTRAQSSFAHNNLMAQKGFFKQGVKLSGAEETTSSDDTQYVTPVPAPFTLRILDENLRNTIDISDFLSVVRNMSYEKTDLTILPENKEVYHPKQTRGHFIRGSLPIIYMFEEYKVDDIRKVMGNELNKLKNANESEVAVIYENEALKEALPVNTADHDVTVCTVEESESSEWPAAIVLLNAIRKDRDEYDTALNRLYTAVSRARVHCVVLFFPDQENVKISDEMYDMEDLLQRLEPFSLRKNHNS